MGHAGAFPSRLFPLPRSWPISRSSPSPYKSAPQGPKNTSSVYIDVSYNPRFRPSPRLVRLCTEAARPHPSYSRRRVHFLAVSSVARSAQSRLIPALVSDNFIRNLPTICPIHCSGLPRNEQSSLLVGTSTRPTRHLFPACRRSGVRRQKKSDLATPEFQLLLPCGFLCAPECPPHGLTDSCLVTVAMTREPQISSTLLFHACH
ncbi:hypothetical protein IWX47DRAFT_688877 [Phyllosticta citricarpa]